MKGTKEGDVKYRVDACRRGKIQLISHNIDSSEDLKRPVVAASQLLGGVTSHCILPIWLKVQPNPIVYFKGAILTMVIGLGDHALACSA